MKKNVLAGFSGFIAVLSLLLCVDSCLPRYIAPSDASQTSFDMSFFRYADQHVPLSENLVVSPYSASVVFSMLAEGSEGETRAEFDNALGGNIFGAESLGDGDTIVVKSANSLWISDNFSVRNRYVSLLSKDFDAYVTTQDFSDPATLKAIDNWCLEHTEDKVGSPLSKLGPDAVMVLVNALYFNASWERPFDVRSTSEKTFYGLEADVAVPMMFSKGRFPYAEHSGWQMIALPYKGGRFSMMVVLPPSGTDMKKAISYVDASMLKSAMGMLSERQVALTLPRFKAESRLVLNPVMKAMGIETAFTSAADFSSISAMGPLVLDEVVQKCLVDVSEEGTEAAATTAAVIAMTSARPAPVVEMNVNRPFFFLIVDPSSEIILFAGRITAL